MRTVTKTYGHERGFSCVFRQPFADSHCHDPHGYPLSFGLTFACKDDQVDKNGWVIDFGGLKPVKAFLDILRPQNYSMLAGPRAG
jgi:6-pyruvoyltetrahydropterin/6-carboxytetrahydropterin synthase